MMLRMSKNDAIREGTYDAWITLMNALGGYPITRDDILTMIREGVRQAVEEHLEAHPESLDQARRRDQTDQQEDYQGSERHDPDRAQDGDQ